MVTTGRFNKCKIWIGEDPILMEKVQRALFKIGYKWGGQSSPIPIRLQEVSLFLDSNNYITYSSSDTESGERSQAKWFLQSSYKEISIAQVIRLEENAEGNYW